MQKLIFYIVCVLIFFAPGYATAHHALYLGSDILYTKAKFSQDYGGDLFNNNATTQFNFFIGYYFTSLFGFEFGYEKDLNQYRSAYIAANSSGFGLENFTNLASNVYNTTKKLYGFNFNYVPELKLTQSLSLIAVFGVSSLTSSDDMKLASFDGDPATVQEQNNYYVQFKTKKLVPRLGVRAQYLVNKHIGARVSCIWENVARLQPAATREINPSQTLHLKLNNASSVGIGLVVIF